MELSTSTIAIIAAAIGGGFAAIVGGAFTFFNTWLQRRHEERRQIRELAVQIALENWKIWWERARGTQFDRFPLADDIDISLIHAIHLISALDGRLKTPEQIKTHLRHCHDAVKAASEEIHKNRDEQLSSKKPQQ